MSSSSSSSTTSSTSSRKVAVDEAMALATDITSGKVSPDELDALLVQELSALVENVVGEGDQLWDIQVRVARAVLAAGGAISGDELRDWASVEDSRSASTSMQGVITPPVEPVEPLSVELRAETVHPEPGAGPGT